MLYTNTSTIYMLKEIKALHPIKIGKHYLFLKSDIETFIIQGLGYDFSNTTKGAESLKQIKIKNKLYNI